MHFVYLEAEGDRSALYVNLENVDCCLLDDGCLHLHRIGMDTVMALGTRQSHQLRQHLNKHIKNQIQ